jgi:hypothetical protein
MAEHSPPKFINALKLPFLVKLHHTLNLPNFTDNPVTQKNRWPANADNNGL